MTYKALQLKKKAMLQALRENCGLVTHACKAAKIGRQTHYDWMHNDEEYAQQVAELKDFVLDIVEESSIRMIKEGKTPAMNIFYLKTLGKSRGFIEKQEIELSTGDMTSLRNVIKECDENNEYERDY